MNSLPPSDRAPSAALIERFRSALAQGRTDEALALTRLLVRHWPQHVVAWKLHADTLFALDKRQAAAQAYARAIELAPDEARHYRRLGECLARLGRDAEAEACLLQALRLDPDDMGAVHGLLAYRPLSPAHPLARRLAQRATAPDATEGERAYAEFLLGRIKLLAGRDDEAFACYARANARMAASGGSGMDDTRVWEVIAAMGAEGTFYPSTPPSGTPAAGVAEPCPAVLVAGLPRSGKSLVEFLLARHPRLAAGGELGGLAHVVDGWQEGPRQVARALRADAEGARRLTQVYAAALAQHGRAGAQRVVDTAPSNLPLLGFLALLHPDVPIILCRRDALDLGAAIFFKKFRSGHRYSYDQAALGTALARAEHLIEHWCAALPNPVLTVRYESLVADPAAARERMLAFLGLPFVPDDDHAPQATRPALLHPSHSSVGFGPIARDLVGFGRRFAEALAPMMAAHDTVAARLGAVRRR